jgi:IS30 family transposase
MGSQYRQLNHDDRLRIESMLRDGHSQRSVARTLGWSHSTISREVRRAAAALPDWPRYMAVLGERVRAVDFHAILTRLFHPILTHPYSSPAGSRCG